MKKFRAVTLNLHKGMNALGTRRVLHELREAIRSSQADLLFLQEVVGSEKQYEFMADQVWTHAAYGKNASLIDRHHGNAILSKYPIIYSFNLDLSLNRYEKRGLLHCKIAIDKEHSVDAFCVHLNLMSKDRKKQIDLISEYLQKHLPKDHSAILAGDFNDWTLSAEKLLLKKTGLQSIQERHHSRNTFPAWFPFLPLDRIYAQNLKVKKAEVLCDDPWIKLSDHLPLMGDFEKAKQA